MRNILKKFANPWVCVCDFKLLHLFCLVTILSFSLGHGIKVAGKEQQQQKEKEAKPASASDMKSSSTPATPVRSKTNSSERKPENNTPEVRDVKKRKKEEVTLAEELAMELANEPGPPPEVSV